MRLMTVTERQQLITERERIYRTDQHLANDESCDERSNIARRLSEIDSRLVEINGASH